MHHKSIKLYILKNIDLLYESIKSLYKSVYSPMNLLLQHESIESLCCMNQLIYYSNESLYKLKEYVFPNLHNIKCHFVG